MKKLTKNIEIGPEFTVSKTDHRFIEVKFTYPSGNDWHGCIPTHYPPMSIQPNHDDLNLLILSAYDAMSPSAIKTKIKETKSRWPKSTQSETYNVFESLLSGKWECRSCGAGKINDQPAARIRDIKKNGFIIATQNRYCKKCKKKQYHDILLIFKVNTETKSELRKPISETARTNIINALGSKDVFFDTSRPKNEFVIDHKFPSQRWIEPETENENLTNTEIVDKFQLLTNQSNMLKSRACDKCCKTGVRPSFLGIKWFYSGNDQWIKSDNPGSGCYGCPWFDLAEWKNKINKKINKK